MRTDDSGKNDIPHLLLRVHALMNVPQRRNYGTDIPLHDAEINMIEAIGNNPNIHAAALAVQLGISKSAVSQIIARLFKKGMITKGRSPGVRSTIALGLTEKGLIARTGGKIRAKRLEKAVNKLLKDADPGERDFLAWFLRKTAAALERLSGEEEPD